MRIRERVCAPIRIKRTESSARTEDRPGVARDIDILTAPGLKHLRDRWWDAAFDEFVHDTLQPRPGQRVLEVGAGAGLTEVTLGLLAPGDVRYVGIDRRLDRVRQ